MSKKRNHCGMCQKTHDASSQSKDELQGGWLVIASLIMFIIPVIMTAVGSLVGGQTTKEKYLGALLGLLCGALSSIVLSHLCKKPLKKY